MSFTLGGNLPHSLGHIALGACDLTPTETDYSLETALVSYLKLRCGLNDISFRPGYVARSDAYNSVVITYERESTDYDTNRVMNHRSNLPVATILFDIWGIDYAAVVSVARKLRLGLDNANGQWGSVSILDCEIKSMDDNKQSPQDGSGHWIFQRSLDFEITYVEI